MNSFHSQAETKLLSIVSNFTVKVKPAAENSTTFCELFQVFVFPAFSLFTWSQKKVQIQFGAPFPFEILSRFSKLKIVILSSEKSKKIVSKNKMFGEVKKKLLVKVIKLTFYVLQFLRDILIFLLDIKKKN